LDKNEELVFKRPAPQIIEPKIQLEMEVTCYFKLKEMLLNQKHLFFSVPGFIKS